MNDSSILNDYFSPNITGLDVSILDKIGLEQLATGVILLNAELIVCYANSSAENMFDLSANQIKTNHITQVFSNCEILLMAVNSAIATNSPYRENEFNLSTYRNHHTTVTCTVTPLTGNSTQQILLILEFIQMDRQLRIAKEERALIQQQANSELLSNLAHEIRNPLGGLRGAAQLLEFELPHANLKEYTQVIINEADRLQNLMSKLLSPHQAPQYALTNIHEVLERVRSLLLAESPRNITVARDYDTSLPELLADKEKLIQAVLNIARNAVQALQQHATQHAKITFKTRAERQVTLARKRYRVAVHLQIMDNGPGIPAAIGDKVFFPMVSEREGGTGLGLSLAQTFITQHHGVIDYQSEPGNTIFNILLPIDSTHTSYAR